MAAETETPEVRAGGAEPGRRLARFSITPEIFVSLGRGVFEVIDNALPEDVALLGAFYDEGRHRFAVIVESESFAPVKDREQIPEVAPPTIRRVKTDE